MRGTISRLLSQYKRYRLYLHGSLPGAGPGESVVSDFFAGLDKMAALIGSERRGRQFRRVVVYGGEERQQRTGVTGVSVP